MTKTALKPSSAEMSASLSLAIHQTQQALDAAISKELGELGITPRQIIVLRAIEQANGGSQTLLVELTGIDRSTLADMMRRLLKNGLVARRRTKEDARAYSVTLTANGQKALAHANKVAAQVEAAAEKAGGGKLIKDLGKVVAALRS